MTKAHIMRVSGPTVRRRNHAWLQMRSLERRAARLARRQEEEDDAADDADTSGDESDDSVESSDDDESETEPDSEPETEPTTTARPPLASVSLGLSSGRGVKLIPLPTAGAGVGAGVTLGAGELDAAPPNGADEPESESDGIESDHEEPPNGNNGHPESTRPPLPPPSATSVSTITGSSGAPTITSASTTAPSTSLDDLVTSLTGTALPTTATPSPTVPVTGSTQSEDEVVDPNRQANEQAGDGLSVGTTTQGKLSSGAIAGIVLGLLAFVALLIGAAMLWRKRRRDRGLPFFPQTRFRLRDDDESRPPSVTGPLPGKVGGQNQAKTNTQIMDDLMKAAYAADNGGTNDMEVAYYAPAAAPKLPSPPPQLPPLHQHQPRQSPSEANHDHEVEVFMDEKAYAALERPPTPGEPKKPVMKWLNEVKTPTQPNGPEIPPTPEMPPSATMPRLTYGGRVPEPPKPAYYGRDTMTTDTTGTSVRWYG